MRKKSLVGWTYTEWRLKYRPKTFNQDIVTSPPIYPSKKDACEWLRLPDREYKAIKVRITIEEVK